MIKAKEKEHILLGLAVAIENIDEMIDLIKKSKDTNEANKKILERKWNAKNLANLLKKNIDKRLSEIIANFDYLTPEQAKAILELRLQRLTGLEREKVEKDLLEESKKIAEYLSILSSQSKN